jgi:CHASE1-domain containing sensor protein
MATPHVAGAVALHLSSDATLSPTGAKVYINSRFFRFYTPRIRNKKSYKAAQAFVFVQNSVQISFLENATRKRVRNFHFGNVTHDFFSLLCTGAP